MKDWFSSDSPGELRTVGPGPQVQLVRSGPRLDVDGGEHEGTPSAWALHGRASRFERAQEVLDQECALDPDLEGAARVAIRLLLQLGHADETRLRVRYLKACLAAPGVASPNPQALFDHMNRHR
ncbi:hypothetical protein GCM10012278_59160 [Nonomuraea glycinis]|uniref:Uncharacterized protein n=1 Tax=Nonomuraea glycinis TaxID=2047744 RepID=A0A918A978_9ACTN|nr:hypothetical protein GCM10012278_59160 [Nonomuraea glycinis]